MSVLNENQLLGAPAGSSQYQIQRSLRFNSADSAYLSRTPASEGNRKTWTWSGWVKRSALQNGHLFMVTAGTSDSTYLRLHLDSDRLYFGAYTVSYRGSTAVFRDPSSWYHIVCAVDTTQATGANRIKLYVNGQQITSFAESSDPAQNADLGVNMPAAHSIGATPSATNAFSGYLADIHFIDGQALTPASFGQTDATTGEWMPIHYAGTYGTNGFKLNFSNNSAATATTLGADSSGNGNNWTPNNLSVTAGAGNDSLVDTPTSYGTDTGVGGEVRGNYCTWNPLKQGATQSSTNGNLDAATGATNYGLATGTIGVTTGKYYWEVTVNSASGGTVIGIVDELYAAANYIGQSSSSVGYNGNGYLMADGNTSVALAASYTAGDVIGVALNLDASEIKFYKNNSLQHTRSSLAAKTWFPAISSGGGGNSTFTANWGARPFAYTAPSGFKALCDTNLAAPTIVKPSTVMDVKLYTGNGTSQTISGVGFSPDFVWMKSRSQASSHIVQDTVRGTSNYLITESTAAEATGQTQAITAFNSDGFSLGSGTSINGNTQTYAAWCWDAGSSTVTNTAGTIQSSVRANASAGISVVTYTGNNTTAPSPLPTVGHGLNIAPSLVISKSRNNAGTETGNWFVWHTGAGTGNWFRLNTTDAAGSISASGGGTMVAPTSTVFSTPYISGSNISGNNYVAYCFAPVAGYSAFGSYTGNGSADGPFVFCNFRPRWIMVKRTTSDVSGGNWIIKDALRNGYNDNLQNLYPNLSAAEQSFYSFDILSNGFKVRSTDVDINGSAATYIYAAFAEFPFQYARAR